ncbi:MAG: GNAT family N-acetyltransferase [Ilumatobacter sp.]|nr:GNAT family N-acetyltransferase [Ilumatobacter sp.]
MAIRIVPANEASWADVQAVFGTRGDAASCQCQWFKLSAGEFRSTTAAEKAEMFRAQANCGHATGGTSGLVAYVDGQPAGWVAVEPRPAYPRMATMRLQWQGRHEDKADPDVWAVTCFVVRPGFRRRGVSTALAAAAVEHARLHGARAVEAYPKDTSAIGAPTSAELFVGTAGMFAAAGFREVTHPTPRRIVMRIDLTGAGAGPS